MEPSYWVWHRNTPLTTKETTAIAAQGVRTLYWHAGTLEAEGPGWRLRGKFELPASSQSQPVTIAPVLRLSAEAASLPLGEAAASSIVKALIEAARRVQAREVQIDFDCPDRRLAEYAVLLAQCRARLAPIRLSATALAGWSRLPAFEKLAGSVDSLMPMFYDLRPDAPGDVRAGRVLPLIGAPTLAAQIESWRACPVPWFAGLPNFARVTVFDRQGASRGHLRAWDWDALCFNPAFALSGQPAPGATVLRAETATVLANTSIAAGETVACRWPDLEHLAQAITLATNAGASGVTIFRLPGEGPQGGWSLEQLGTLCRDGNPGHAEFKLQRRAHALELANVSHSDARPRLAGSSSDRDRGWQLEVDCPSGAVFREAGAGEFARVFAHADPDAAEPKVVPIPLAQRLTFWFADLKAGQSRQTGLLQIAPGVDWSTLRWRVPGSENLQWQSIE